jgi:hypothetical protein
MVTSCNEDASDEVKQMLPTWAKYYEFTGTLRPCLQSPRRTIPDSIPRPDYATHPNGVSLSEQMDKTTNQSIPVYKVSAAFSCCGFPFPFRSIDLVLPLLVLQIIY